MKFKSKADIALFLAEIERFDEALNPPSPDNFVLSEEHKKIFIKKRRGISNKLKDFRRSQNAKASWRKSRSKYNSGIKKFHKSTEGKRFHRNMGRFLSTRENFSQWDISEKVDFLKALSSMKTHAIIELDYYMPLQEELNYWLFLDELFNVLDRVEKQTMSEDIIEPDDKEFLLRCTEPYSICSNLTEDFTKHKDLIRAFSQEASKDGDFSYSEALEKTRRLCVKS